MVTATQEKPKTKTRRFRLLRGGHVDKNAFLVDKDGKKIPCCIEAKGEDGEVLYNLNPEVNEGRGFEGCKYNHLGKRVSNGDVIETTVDLVAMFGRNKFAPVGNEGVTEQLVKHFDSTKDLEKMDVPALRQTALEEEIDLTGLKTKPDIVQRIVNARLQ